MQEDLLHRKNAICEINYIPLLDILLVLLIIFIISSSISTSYLNINVPNANNSTDTINQHDRLIISIDENLNYFINDDPISSIDELLINISNYQDSREKTKIYIQANKNITYDSVVQLLDILKKNGCTHIALVTNNNAQNNKLPG